MSDTTIINRRDLDFQLFEVLDTEALTAHPRFSEHSRETFTVVLDTAQAIASEKFAPHNRNADENEPHLDPVDGQVHLIPDVAVALEAFVQAGFLAASYDFEEGGMQLPAVVSQAAMSIFASANMSTTVYPLLSMGNASVIHRYGSAEQKKRYWEPLMAGRFFGTMALTEPQAGSGLADLKTSATPNPDGSYAIRGNKIFISAGDHPLSENIVHLGYWRASKAHRPASRASRSSSCRSSTSMRTAALAPAMMSRWPG
jgi:alkylation response protein AidB-like acyl-CoA dehydrogenase